MKPTTNETTAVLGKSRQELDAGYQAYLASLKQDIQTIVGHSDEPKREIGYHAYMGDRHKKRN